MVFQVRQKGMDVQFTESPAKGDERLRTEVLIREEKHKVFQEGRVDTRKGIVVERP